ncbi:microtubule-associated protein 10 [Hemicordylus capensis]|uniref:microtubule-associated protein 10 n=1 Tax=Hemicordylus capensis TaxID=884348 RepID=UPI0023029927|nr:microtubule-associated protein 10 [Hemicordylus capensis]
MMEEGESCDAESLFSLELLVESARVEPRLLPAPLPAIGPFRPAVALRLLDFPTLLVRAPHAVPGPLVPFGRGKSCLFRLRPDALKGLLRRSPLCALLLALPPTPGPARLLGSSSVSLAAAAEELLQGTGPGGRRGLFPLRDLMGESVGELGLSYRLTNLGANLLGHLGQGAAPDQQRAEEEDDEQLPPPPPPSPPPLFPPSTHERKVHSLELIPEGEEDQDPAPEGSSPSLRSFSSIATEPQPGDSSPSRDLIRELDNEANVFCPPPMYYSRASDTPRLTPRIPVSVPVATPRKSFQKEDSAPPFSVPVKGRPPSGAKETAALSLTTPGSPELLKQTLSQLPLLNALLVELSLLNNQPLKPGPSTVHPQLAWLYRNVEEGTNALPPSAKSACPCWEEKKTTPHRKERERLASPKLKRNRPDRLKCLSPTMLLSNTGKGYTKIAASEKHGTERYNTKENSPPRRKLTYGLTNTLWLRLQRTNPSMINAHEKKEQHRRKKADLLVEKKGKSSSAKGKLVRDSHERQPKSVHPDSKGISDENVQFNENIETLIQSSIVASDVKGGESTKEMGLPEKADSDYKEKNLKVHLPRVQNAQFNENIEPVIQSSVDKVHSAIIKEVSSDFQNSFVTSGVKRGESTKEKSPFEVSDSTYKEANLKVRLPRVSLQDNTMGNKLETEAEKCVQLDQNSSFLCNHSQSNGFESSHELKDSDEVVASYENTVYSEDFTNADSSSVFLEVPESSPEPLLVNPKQSQSTMGLDAKMSERSLTPEGVSPPLPIPSATSPVQSLKKTSVLKSNGKDMIVALDKLDEEELVAQQFKKEEGKDVQPFQDKQMSSDMNDNVPTDQSSVEKSHSLRTSQVSSYLPSNVSDLDVSGLEESKTSDKEGENMLDITNQYRHVSELVVNKLPGYTM